MRAFATIISLFLAISLQAQTPREIFHLWNGNPPTQSGLTQEYDNGDFIRDVIDASLTVYVPEKPCGLAILACPGGGYHDCWWIPEGKAMAQWYLNQGITYAVLKYRMPNGHREIPLDDVHEAMRILWQHADEYGFSKLGIQGNSAGGHLAAMASTHYTSKANRPDFTILFYPVITLDPSYTHGGTLHNLLGANPSQQLIDAYSNEKQVTADTPPAFIMHSSDDNVVPVRNSIEYYSALTAHGVSATMHIYPVGGHGWSFHDWFPYKRQWTGELEHWLRQINK